MNRKKYTIKNTKFSTESICNQTGEKLEFKFDLISEKASPQNLVIDYKIHYVRKTAKSSVKVFKLKEIELKALDTITIYKQQQFKDFTTRKHYRGIHIIELLINGELLATESFDLTI